MLKIPVVRDYYDVEEELFLYESLELDEGITILVGCNGSGKTTLIHQIQQFATKNNISCFSYDDVVNGRTAAMQILLEDDIDQLGQLYMSSEGERINKNFSNRMYKFGKFVKDSGDAKDCVLTIDGYDSGTSIDMIDDLINFFNMLIEDFKERDKNLYIVMSTNNYEPCIGNMCVDVTTGDIIEFKTYNEYREFILESSRFRDGRYGR